jgi:hypothetical protein
MFYKQTTLLLILAKHRKNCSLQPNDNENHTFTVFTMQPTLFIFWGSSILYFER